ncbi:organomercurial lyase [Nonomuraea rubra]
MTSTTAGDAQRLVALIRRQITRPDIALTLWRLLAEHGEPVGIGTLAAAGGWSEREVAEEFARQPGTDYDSRGRIAGFGLTLHATAHAFTFDGRTVTTVYGFCASDTLGFPVVLGRPGVAVSACPVTGAPVRVELTPDGITSVDPACAVVSRMRPGHAVPDVRELCNLGNFFASADAAASWRHAHPDGQVVPVAEEFEVVRRAAIELGWAPAAEPSP